MTRTTRMWTGGLVCLGASLLAPAAGAQPGLPSLQDVLEAHAIVVELQTYVAQVIEEATGGTTSPSCDQITDRETCESAHCIWDDGFCFSPENDVLALNVLLSIQDQAVQQGSAMTAAAQAHPGPGFAVNIKKACDIGLVIVGLAIQGRELAAWPAVGVLTPQKFDPALAKETKVRTKMKCV